jgi:hypothetical protein
MIEGAKHSRLRMLILGHFPGGTAAWHLLFSLILVMLQPAAGISLVSLTPQLNDFQYSKMGFPKAPNYCKNLMPYSGFTLNRKVEGAGLVDARARISLGGVSDLHLWSKLCRYLGWHPYRGTISG